MNVPFYTLDKLVQAAEHICQCQGGTLRLHQMRVHVTEYIM